MFNLGSNDKEELQENMQEIKSLIEDGDQEPQQAPPQGGNSPQQAQQNQTNQAGQQTQSQQDPQTQFEQKVAQKAQQSQTGQQTQASTPDITSDSSQNQGQNMQNNSSNSSQTAGQSPGQNQSSQPSQEKVINQDEEGSSGREASRPSNTASSPSKDEPMFLREEDFLNVREMIEEMTYLTQEMDDNLDKLKKTVHEERNTSKNAMELVQAFSKRRSEIESTIESGQK